METRDAIVVGSGPNGLAAAVTLARAGRSVLVLEAAHTLGGGTRTEELTEPGVLHDVCSTAHPAAVLSPFLRSLPLAEHGLSWSQPELPFAHAIRPGESAVVHRDVAQTADGLGSDGATYRRIMGRLVADWPKLEDAVLGPIVRIPKHPVALGVFGLRAIRSAVGAAGAFDEEATRALFAGAAAHSFLPLSHPMTASFGWFLTATAHLAGWPVATGGSARIADALVSIGRSLGVEHRTDAPVESLRELPPSDVVLLDVTPDQFARLAGDRLPAGYLRRASRWVRGPGAFKVDISMDGPIPWSDPRLGRAGTVHLDGTLEQIDAAETDVFAGRHTARPFMLVVQATAYDSTRAPEGVHTVWAYAHTPNGSTRDQTEHIIGRIEDHAPGFRDRIRRHHVLSPAAFEARNRNYGGGDISGGAHTLKQLVFRPFPQRDPYATPIDGVYLCSSSTPPGAGTHGMCGHLAARSALRWTGT